MVHKNKSYRVATSDGVVEGFGEDGEAYRNVGGDKSFLDNAIGAISKIASGTFGAALVEYLVQSDQTITITEGENSYDKTIKTIGWDPKDENGGVSRVGDGKLTTSRPPFVGLAHEFGHAGDHLNGTLNTKIWKKIEDSNGVLTPVTYSERNAITTENFVRADHGINFRTHYSHDVFKKTNELVGLGSVNEIPGDTSFLMLIIVKISVQMTMKF